MDDSSGASRAPETAATPQQPAPPPSPQPYPTEPAALPPAPADPRQHGVVLDGALGPGSRPLDVDSSTVLVLASDALYYGPVLELGIVLDTGWHVDVAQSTIVIDALAGFKIDASPVVRLELLAEGGAHVFDGMGNDTSSEALEDVREVLPYLGARGGFSLLLGGDHRVLLGAWIVGGRTLGQATGSVRTETCLLSCFVSDEPYTVGGASWSALLRVGGVVAKF